MKNLNKIIAAVFLLFQIVHYSLFIDNCNAQWILQTVPQNSGIALSIDFIDSNIGLSCGMYNLHGRSLYTSDGGTHWLLSIVPDSSRSFVTVDIIDSLTGFMAGAYNLFPSNISYSPLNKLQRNGFNRSTFDRMKNIGFSSDADYKGLFVKTTDGGRNWFTYGSLPSQISYLIGMDFIDENTGVVTTSIQDSSFEMNSSILKTTDGGFTWTEILNIDTVRQLSAIEFIDSDKIIAVGYGGSSDTMHNNSGGMIFKSTDGGSSWNLQFFPHKEFIDISFTDQFTGFVANNGPVEGSIYKTTDQGLNWDNEYIISGDALLITGLEFYKGSGTGMIYGSLSYSSSLVSFTRRSTDYGDSWMQLQLLNTTGWDGLYGGTMISQYNQYISGGNPTGQAAIYHTTNGGLVNVNLSGNSISEKFSLSQNFPNPFNPLTNLEFGISDLGFVTLKVYDILGKDVVTLVNEKLSPGKYKVEFDGSGLTSGVYFYQLVVSLSNPITAGEFTDTKRMMLLK